MLYRNILEIYKAIKNEDKETLTELLEKGHQVKQQLGE